MEYSHCTAYEHLTMEEKLLVDRRMKEFLSDTRIKAPLYGPYGPMDGYHTFLKCIEYNTIRMLKMEKNNGRQTGE